jgi:hypothetical protein
MSGKRRLSQLSFAAAALLISAVAASAQTESKAGVIQDRAMSFGEDAQIARLGSERLSIRRNEAKKTSESRIADPRPGLSRGQFIEAARQTSFANPGLGSQSAFLNSPKAPRETDQNESGSRVFTFVPSRGQKLPCQ